MGCSGVLHIVICYVDARICVPSMSLYDNDLSNSMAFYVDDMSVRPQFG